MTKNKRFPWIPLPPLHPAKEHMTLFQGKNYHFRENFRETDRTRSYLYFNLSVCFANRSRSFKHVVRLSLFLLLLLQKVRQMKNKKFGGKGKHCKEIQKKKIFSERILTKSGLDEASSGAEFLDICASIVCKQ